MKFSVFLCLLPLTWSNPPDSQSSNNFVFSVPQGQNSLNIWVISGENAQPQKTSYEVPKNDFFFQSHLTYIIVEIMITMPPRQKRCHAFYWVGSNTTLPHRQHTATFIPTLTRELEEQIIKDCGSITLSREKEYGESTEFKIIFRVDLDRYQVLYKVTGSKGQYVIEIPWFYSELNGSDTFLLRTDSTVFIWNGESYKKEPAELCSRNHKEETARALEYRIRHYDNRNFLTKLRTGSMDLEFPKYFETFKNTFFFHMQDVPPSRDFPTQPQFIPDNEIWRKRNKEFEAYEYYSENGIIVASEIDERPLTLDRFKSQHTYLILDHYIGNVFMYIGKHATSDIIASILSDAEHYHIHMNSVAPNSHWRKVIVIREGYLLPAPFIFLFPDEVDRIKQEYNRSQYKQKAFHIEMKRRERRRNQENQNQ